MKEKRRSAVRKLLILTGWLLAWQLLSLVCNNSILLVGPWETLLAFLQNMITGDFWRTVCASYGRIAAGFLTGSLCGILLAAGSLKWKLMEEALSPFMNLIKAIPVASFTVLLLIWWGAPWLSTSICFLVVLPQIYVSTLEGLKSTDHKLLEMAEVFHMPFWNRLFYIYRPALKPFLSGGFQIAAGMAWKSGVAAEVIGTPDDSIGERLYLSKIYLDTADVLAWTAVTILLSIVTERLVLWCLACFLRWEPHCRKPVRRQTEGVWEQKKKYVLKAEHIYKSYHKAAVIEDYSEVYEAGKIYCFTTPSGSGKTTLFRLLAGLEMPDGGRISQNSRISMLFQEDRLCEDYSAVKNVEMVTGDREGARRELEKLLPGKVLDRPCCELSGGMRRRAALVRAVAAEGDCLLLDEPFTGLDEENRKKAASYIAEAGKEKAILIASHDAVLTDCGDKMLLSGQEGCGSSSEGAE